MTTFETTYFFLSLLVKNNITRKILVKSQQKYKIKS